MEHCSDYTGKLAGSLNDMRKEHQLCDVTINVSGTPFLAHKNVLAASSEYFMAMFTHGFKEKAESEIILEGNPAIFEVLLEYAYTGTLKVTPQSAYHILEMASYMQFTDVHQHCCKLINLHDFSSVQEKISIEDAFKMYHLALMHKDLREVVKKSMKYLCDHFQEMREWDKFLNDASHAFLLEYLKQEDLASQEEEVEVLDMVMAWLRHDWENRRIHASSLLNEVRLGLVSEEKLKVLLEGDVLEITACKELYEKVLQELKTEESFVKRAYTHPHFFATRSTITAPLILSAEGSGQDYSDYRGPVACHFQYFNSDKKKWTILNKFPAPPYLAAIVAVDRNLYAVGGYHNGDYDEVGHDKPSIEFYKFDHETNMWQKLPSMIYAHLVECLSLVHVDGFIYVIGGQWVGLQVIERFDILEKKWEELPDPPYQGNDMEIRWSVPIVYEGKILVYNESSLGFRHPTTYEIFEYNPTTNVWQTILTEVYDGGERVFMIPALIEAQGSIYRVLYKKQHGEEKPMVNILQLQSLGNGIRVSVGEEICQDGIPVNKLGAFRIQEDVFVNANGFIFKTDLKIGADQTSEVDLQAWEHFALKWEELFQIGLLENSNVTYYTFDKNKFGDSYEG